MAIRIPSLQDKRCKLLIVCGDLKTGNRDIIKWLKDQPPYFMARRSPKSGSGYVGTFFHGRGEVGLHVEIVSREFAGDRPEKPNDKMADIQNVFARLEGREIDADIEGFFPVPRADLPPLIRASMVKTKADDVSIEAVGGTFSVRGAPVYRMQWSSSKDDDQVVIHLQAKKSTTINETYLEEALDLIESAFSVLVQSGRHDA